MMCSCRIFISCLWRRAAASDAPQGSWLEGGRSGGSGGEETAGIFRDQADSAGMGRFSWRAWKKFTHLSIELPIQLSVREAKGVSGDGGRILAMRRPVTLLPTGLGREEGSERGRIVFERKAVEREGMNKRAGESASFSSIS